MENQIIRTKIVQRENNKETCAALEMTEEEFQKIISIYGKGEPTIRELKPYSERLQEAQKATLPGEELKEQIDELMRQYADEKIDSSTYAQKMMELTTSAQDEIDEN